MIPRRGLSFVRAAKSRADHGMALHCVWTTSSFSAAVLKAANMCGDADTVAAVVGQVAGAIYGASAIVI